MTLIEKYYEFLGKNRQHPKDLISSGFENGGEKETITLEKKLNNGNGSDVINEILKTIKNYLAIFSVDENNRYHIIGLNRKVEEIESIKKEEALWKCIEETPLVHRVRLTEILNQLQSEGDMHKLSVSPDGDDSEGYYIGFRMPSGAFVITWAPGDEQKSKYNLHKQEIVFEQFAEMLPEMIYEIDSDGRILFGNQQGLGFLGYSKEDLKIGKNISDLFPENCLEMFRNLKTLRLPGQTTCNEYKVKRKDGTFAHVISHSFAVFLDDRIIGYRGVLTDISKQREYENQIKREKAFLEHLYNSIPSAIVITGSDDVISMVNREFTTLFGYTSEEAVNKNINDLIVPENLKEEARRIDRLTSMNKKETIQTVRRNRWGININVTLVSTSIVINSETVAHLIIYRDITAEKKNQLLQEILFNISTAALKQVDFKDMYPTIVNELSKIWDTNNFFIALYDKSSDTLSLPFFSDEKDNFKELPAPKTITNWVIKQNKAVLLRETDLKMLEEKGEVDLIGTPCKIWMGVPLKVEGNIMGVMCLQDYNDENKFSNDDLSVLEFIANQIAIAIQRRMMIDNLVTARQKAEEAAQSKQTFMSTMSHEIRTPLNEVIGITNLLLQGNPRPDQMDYLNTLKFSGNYLLTLVNDVLDYNKIESDKIVFEQTSFNLGEFLDEIMRSYSFRSKTKNLLFSIEKNGNLPVEVIGDPIRLNQILSNLLSNALKFTSEGSIKVIVKELSRTNDKSKLEFTVVDTGIGIASENHSIIFDSFTQATAGTTRQYGGTGLGLAICKKLIELQGGTISIESELGKGSSFRFVITLGIADKNNQARTTEVSENFIGLEGKKVLVAEDNKINFYVANKFLTGWGISVTHAENGQLALEEVEKEDFDLILMDLHMPIMDGIEATRIIRKSEKPRIKDIPIVALTAAIMSESHDKIDDLNINDYVLKPFKPHDLFARILKHIR